MAYGIVIDVHMNIHLGMLLTNTKSLMDPRESILARQEEPGRSAPLAMVADRTLAIFRKEEDGV